MLQPHLDAGVERIVVVGGDGTLHHVVNLVMCLPAERRPSLAMVPGGTGSDFSRMLNLPRGFQDRLRMAMQGRAQPIDLLRIEYAHGIRHAINTLSAGFSAVVADRVNRVEGHGKLTYLAQGVRTLFDYQHQELTVRADNEVLADGPLFMLAVTNGIFFGNGIPVAPEACFDDGVANLVMMPKLTLAARIYYMAALLIGRHSTRSGVVTEQVSQVQLSGCNFLELDGEMMAVTEAEVSVVPQAVRFVTRP